MKAIAVAARIALNISSAAAPCLDASGCSHQMCAATTNDTMPAARMNRISTPIQRPAVRSSRGIVDPESIGTAPPGELIGPASEVGESSSRAPGFPPDAAAGLFRDGQAGFGARRHVERSVHAEQRVAGVPADEEIVARL